MDIRAIVHDYYKELQNAINTGKVDASKFHFADNVVIEGPGERFEGTVNAEEMFGGFSSLLSNVETLKQYFDADSACTFVRFTSKDGKHTILATEIITIKNGEIVKIDAIFDTKQWAQFMPAQ